MQHSLLIHMHRTTEHIISGGGHMKSTINFLVLIFGLLLVNTAHAETPREQLKQMVEQLQQTPNDNVLREKIIKLAATIKPAPAIPEEARKPFVMGATVFKKASDSAGASKAVDLFTQALNIAPWFADAYYNRAMAQQAAGQFNAAADDLKLYLGFKLTDAERREVQDKIYSLEADAQLAATKKAEEQKVAAAKAAEERERLRPSVEGRWDSGIVSFQVIKSGEAFDIVPGLMFGRHANQWVATDIKVDRQRVRFGFKNVTVQCPECNISYQDLSLSESGNELSGTGTVNGDVYPSTYKRLP